MWLKGLVVIISVAVCVNGYSSGAPETTCVDMVPGHPVPAQKSAAPYIITTNTKVAKAGQPIEVVISGIDASHTIKGMLLQARHGKKPIGKFTIPPTNNIAQLMNCGEPGNAITHKKHDEKDDKQTVAFTWTPPAGFTGEIKFRATIAFNGAVFWVGVESAPIKITS